MIKTSIYKFLISFFLFFCSHSVYAQTFASLSPVPTEIIYALGAQDKLLGVSSACDYPQEVQNKPIIGDTYFVNMESIIKLKPDYLLSMQSAKPMLGELSLTKTKPIYFEFQSIEDIYSAIFKIAELTNKNKQAELLVRNIKSNVSKFKTKKPKKILYLVQIEPLITIGKQSFVTDIIQKSGHESITADINHYYPSISLEYAIKSHPDVVVICYGKETGQMRELFPKAKFVYLNKKQQDVINRPGPRVWEAVKFFSEI